MKLLIKIIYSVLWINIIANNLGKKVFSRQTVKAKKHSHIEKKVQCKPDNCTTFNCKKHLIAHKKLHYHFLNHFQSFFVFLNAHIFFVFLKKGTLNCICAKIFYLGVRKRLNCFFVPFNQPT